ncbi:MAG: tetratricopeptide repeat protein [Myxococcales bacterium]|nr:tetratricopeptide repeat protein [Myxococcales bacterium]
MPRWLALGMVVALLAIPCLTQRARAQSLESINRELADIEGSADHLTRNPLRRVDQQSPTHVEERLTDGELYYRLQDYLRASIIFTDIVDNYPTHAAYPDALFLLADSLFKAGDNLGARTRFRMILDRAGEQPFRPYVQRALGRLIEIAIHIRDFDGVEAYFQQLSRLPPTEIEATTTYFRGKYLYNRAVPSDEILRENGDDETSPQLDLPRLDEARQTFEAVPEGSPYYLQSRYFVGVIYTLRGQYPQAIEAFRRVLRGEATTPESRDVVDLTQLALGRLYYETDQLDQAIEAYQAVPRTSNEFDTALYEIAWVYIRLGDSTRAERALEVLAIAAPDSHYIPDAKVLRGNLLLRNGRFEDATQVFREVRQEFGPIRRELDQVRTAHGDLFAYFRGLVRDNMEDFDANDFLPESARRWVDLESGDFNRALGVLSDLSQARRLVRETSDLIERLDAALGTPNRVAAFTDLRDAREGTTGLRNRLARVRGSLMAIEERTGGSGNAELQSVRQQRRTIEATLGRMPTAGDDFGVRDDQLLGRYRALERQLSSLEVELMGMDARVVATERFLHDTAAEQHNAEAVQSELTTHRAAVVAYRAQIQELQRMIELGRLQVGVGDPRYERDTRLRDEYNRLVERERQLHGGNNSQLDVLFGRITVVEGKLNRRDVEIDAVVEERVSAMQRVINEERQKLVGYREALASLEGETEVVVGGVTAENFDHIRNRFYDIVLRADVGRIDVTWAEREEHRTRVDSLTRDRSREIQSLDDEFRDIMDEGSDTNGDSSGGQP